MFDIGFWELTLIGVVALLVFGPERLPEVARTAGLWVSRIRRFITNVKRDVEQELRAEELKQFLNKPNPLNEVHEILEDTRRSLERTVATTPTDPTSPLSSDAEGLSGGSAVQGRPAKPAEGDVTDESRVRESSTASLTRADIGNGHGEQIAKS